MSVSTLDILNRLLVIHHCSLPAYLAQASPVWSNSSGKESTVLAQVVADQQAMTDRLLRAILDQGGEPRFGRFPGRFAALNDLSFGYLSGELIGYQQRTITAIAHWANQLPASSQARALGDDALRQANHHLQLLCELGD